MDNPDWYTPASYVEAARRVMGGIDCDPCSDARANRSIRATIYYTAETNGLDHRWGTKNFINPPGGQVAAFWNTLVEKWAESEHDYTTGGSFQAIWIGYSLEQLQTLQVAAEYALTPLDFSMCVPARRIAFEENDHMRERRLAKAHAKGKVAKDRADSPSHGNYITYIGPNTGLFQREFAWFGQVVVRGNPLRPGPAAAIINHPIEW